MSDESKITDPDFQPMSEESKSKGQLLSLNSDLRALLTAAELELKKARVEIEELRKQRNEQNLTNCNLRGLSHLDAYDECQLLDADIEAKKAEVK